MQIQFKVGDKAVYPAHGVGQVTSIENKEIAGQKCKFYILKLMDNDMTIMVPTNRVTTVGLRHVTPKQQVDEVYKILKRKQKPLDRQTWNRRYREYMEKIKTGSIYEIAEVMRDLYQLKNGKDLSFGERRMLDMAKGLLVKEISIAKRKEEADIEKEINNLLTRGRAKIKVVATVE